jgi:hypothetical protein
LIYFLFFEDFPLKDFFVYAAASTIASGTSKNERRKSKVERHA